MISGTCDLSQRYIYVGETCHVAHPPFGPHTELQFNLDIPIDEINDYCKSIYGEIQFEIREEKMENGLKIDELREFIKSLHELNEKYMKINLLDLCTVLRKIVELLKKLNLSEEDKEFMKDMENIGNLYKPGTPERIVLNNYFKKDSHIE